MTHEAAGRSFILAEYDDDANHILVVRLTPSRSGECRRVTRWARGIREAFESLADCCTVQIDLCGLSTTLLTAIRRRESEQTGIYFGAVLVYEAMPSPDISLSRPRYGRAAHSSASSPSGSDSFSASSWNRCIAAPRSELFGRAWIRMSATGYNGIGYRPTDKSSRKLVT